VAAEPDMWGQVALYDNELDLFVWGFPPGTVIGAGTTEVIVNDEGKAKFKAPGTEMFGTAKVPERPFVMDKFAGASFRVQAPGQPVLNVPIPELKVNTTQVLQQVASGPVSFSTDVANAPVQTAILIGDQQNRLIGLRATTLQEIDAIAITTREGTEVLKCEGYVDDNGQMTAGLDLALKDTVTTVYERTSGNVIAKQTFPAKKRCPDSYVSYGSTAQQDSPIPYDEIESWVSKQLVR